MRIQVGVDWMDYLETGQNRIDLSLITWPKKDTIEFSASLIFEDFSNGIGRNSFRSMITEVGVYVTPFALLEVILWFSSEKYDSLISSLLALIWIC